MSAPAYDAVREGRAPRLVEGDTPRQALARKLDYFPTPPWATRALMEFVLPQLGLSSNLGSVWEPAAGEGHMSRVLDEYTPHVAATDIHPWGGARDGHGDFLASPDRRIVNWIVTNPPFGAAQAFVLAALARSFDGVAILARSSWAEGVGRYRDLFGPHPPAAVAQFSERVPMTLGRWDPAEKTSTAYAWFVWLHHDRAPCRHLWIPPCRAALTRRSDVGRFATSASGGAA